jgi:penicillin-binding protein 1A
VVNWFFGAKKRSHAVNRPQTRPQAMNMAQGTSSPSQASPHFSDGAAVPDAFDPNLNHPQKRWPRPPKPVYTNPLFWLVILLGAGLAGPVTRATRFVVAENAKLPDVSNALTFERQGTITIKADDDTVLQKIGPATQEYLQYDQMPATLIQAFIASEDRRFYEHQGIDYKGIGRAVMANVRNREVVEGASTITQQLARIVFLDQDRSFQRKFREALLAYKLEDELGKEKVLERYLNLVYLGAGAYGVADAAWIYFGKSVEDLSVSEIALIAGVAPAPSAYSPLVDAEAAKTQRDIVIRRMLENGVISQSQADEAYASEVKTTPNEPKFLYSEFPYFTMYVQKQLAEILTPEQIEGGGLTVETTLNIKWQRAAEKTLAETIDDYGRGQRFKQGAIVAVDPRSGEIRAMVGGTDFGDSQFNRVTQAQRQPGSTFKAFVYATAIATGMSPYKSYVDARYVVDGYEPKNYGGGFSGGSVELRRALASSINIVAVKVLVDVGFEPVIALAQRMGIKSELRPTYSLALGASEVNLLEITSAYGTFANEGKHVTSHGISRILDREGKVIYQFDDKPEQAIDKDSAAIMAWMMRSVVEGGTGGNAALRGRQVAGKTGTSEKNRDLWFIGYMPNLVVGVWFGNDDNSPTRGASSTAALAWGRFVKQFIDDIPVEKFPELPRLGRRRGSIEAQPLKPRRVIADKAGSPSSGDTENRRRGRTLDESQPLPDSETESNTRESAPAEDTPPSRQPSDSRPSDSRDNDDYRPPTSRGSESRNDDSAPAPAPAPAPDPGPVDQAPDPAPAPAAPDPAPAPAAPAPAPAPAAPAPAPAPAAPAPAPAPAPDAPTQ